MTTPISRSSNSNSNINNSDKKAEASKRERLALNQAIDNKQSEQIDFGAQDQAHQLERVKVDQAMQEAQGFGFNIVRLKAENGEVLSFRMSDLQNWGYGESTPQAGMEKWGNVPEPKPNNQRLQTQGANRQAVSGPPAGVQDPIGFGKEMESQNSYFFNSAMNNQLTEQLFASKRTVRRMNDAMQAKWRLIMAQIMSGDFVGAVSSITMMLEMDSRAAITSQTESAAKQIRNRSNLMRMIAENVVPATAGPSEQSQANHATRMAQWQKRESMFQNTNSIMNQAIQYTFDGIGDMRKAVNQVRDWAVGFKEDDNRTKSHEANARMG